jgi:UDP-N-acetylglucosamine 2-epimerase
VALKVLTIVGTRPEIIKLSRVIHQLDMNTEHILVHTGQNYDYELNEIFFQQLEIRKPDHFLNAAGDTVAQTIGNVIVPRGYQQLSCRISGQEAQDPGLSHGSG